MAKKVHPGLIIGIIVFILFFVGNIGTQSSVITSTKSSCESNLATRQSQGYDICTECFEVTNSVIDCAMDEANTNLAGSRGKWRFYLDDTSCNNLNTNTKTIISECVSGSDYNCEERDIDITVNGDYTCKNDDCIITEITKERVCEQNPRGWIFSGNNLNDDIPYEMVFGDLIECCYLDFGGCGFTVNECNFGEIVGGGESGIDSECPSGDGDCESNERCRDDRCVRISDIPDTCTADNDCENSEICVSNDCIDGCRTDGDCGAGEECTFNECVTTGGPVTGGPTCDDFWKDPKTGCQKIFSWIIWIGIGFGALIALQMFMKK